MSTKRNDLKLILTLLIIACLGIAYLFLFRPFGKAVRVMVDGNLYGTYPLNQNLTEDILTGDENKQSNRLVINDGKARIEYATCPDEICVAHMPIFRDGESIVCLPNRVVITVIGSENNSVDIVS
jgi:hypothetical protein